MNAFGFGSLVARERLRGKSPALVLGLGCAGVYLVGLLERRADAVGAADTTLSGAVFGITLPIFTFLACERVCSGERLTRSVDAVARHGVNRRGALLGLLLTLAACMALVAVLLTSAALLGTRASASDFGISVAIALGAGAVYALLFGVASLLGKRGGGRRWALGLDLLFGAGSSFLAAPWPRAHVRNLLGGEPALELTQPSAWLCLALIGTLSLLLSAWRSPE